MTSTPAILNLSGVVQAFLKGKEKISTDDVHNHLVEEAKAGRVDGLTAEDAQKLNKAALTKLIAAQVEVVTGKPPKEPTVEVNKISIEGEEHYSFFTQKDTSYFFNLKLATDEPKAITLKTQSGQEIKVSKEEIERVNKEQEYFQIELADDGKILGFKANEEKLKKDGDTDKKIKFDINGTTGENNEAHKLSILIDKVDLISEKSQEKVNKYLAGGLGIGGIVAAIAGFFLSGENKFGSILGTIGGVLAAIGGYMYFGPKAEVSSEDKKDTKDKSEKKAEKTEGTDKK